jgi:hypothetical protein
LTNRNQSENESRFSDVLIKLIHLDIQVSSAGIDKDELSRRQSNLDLKGNVPSPEDFTIIGVPKTPA